MSTALIAALPREIAGLTRGWKRFSSSGRVEVLVRQSDGAVAACAGIGVVRAALAVEAALAAGGVDRLLSVGLAGACDPGLRAGDVVRCGPVVDARSGERYAGDTGESVLVTGGVIAGVAEKQRLAASYGAAVVDMEAAAVGRLARAHGLRFGAIKAISDQADVEMQGMNAFVTEEGRFRTAAFALHIAVRPGSWARVTQLGRDSARAVAALHEALSADLAAEQESRNICR